MLCAKILSDCEQLTPDECQSGVLGRVIGAVEPSKLAARTSYQLDQQKLDVSEYDGSSLPSSVFSASGVRRFEGDKIRTARSPKL